MKNIIILTSKYTRMENKNMYKAIQNEEVGEGKRTSLTGKRKRSLSRGIE